MQTLKTEIQERLILRLGYRFTRPELLQLALTHRSVSASNNNERLEFLGDSILNFVIGHFLFDRFPKEKEGNLSRLRASLVKEPTLAEVARDLALGDVLILGQGELKSGGFRRDSILADALEAILAAIYLDSASMEVCRDCLLRWFGGRLTSLSTDSIQKDAKTRLQEWLQARHLPLPSYEITATQGDAHNQYFHVICKVGQLSDAVPGKGGSRREAEQVAAAMALARLQEGES